MSVEPSMEEILSSIKRIIAEEEAPTGRRRPVRPTTPEPMVEDDGDADPDTDGVLELSDPMPAYPQAVPVSRSAPVPTVAVEPQEPADIMPAPTFPDARVAATATPSPVATGAPTADPIVSSAAADATRGALASLSRLMVKPEPNGDGTLEGLVRDMLRPMLREWLDANLPAMVEVMVSREIARISGKTD